jgi:putative effector of murein hydrolase
VAIGLMFGASRETPISLAPKSVTAPVEAIGAAKSRMMPPTGAGAR